MPYDHVAQIPTGKDALVSNLPRTRAPYAPGHPTLATFLLKAVGQDYFMSVQSPNSFPKNAEHFWNISAARMSGRERLSFIPQCAISCLRSVKICHGKQCGMYKLHPALTSSKQDIFPCKCMTEPNHLVVVASGLRKQYSTHTHCEHRPHYPNPSIPSHSFQTGTHRVLVKDPLSSSPVQF